jgi:hypothetical protein
MSYNNNDEDILSDTDKGVKEARGVLAVIFRQFLKIRGITGYVWERLMTTWLDDPGNGVEDNSRARSTARGNLNSALRRPDMTWRVFMRALEFLRAARVDFIVKVTWFDGSTDTVTARLKDLSGPMRRESDDDEDNPPANRNRPIK